MFRVEFKSVLSGITGDQFLINELYDEIKNRYSEAGRYYHTHIHLDNMTRQLLAVKDQIKDWPALMLAVAYHDIVYDVMSHENEENSAILAYERLGRLGLAESVKENCRKQILATKTHQQSLQTDTNFLLDADLSILGSDELTYNSYTEQIRAEYSYYPDPVYRPARKKVLIGFLARTAIFQTNYFQHKYESGARTNILKEIGSMDTAD